MLWLVHSPYNHNYNPVVGAHPSNLGMQI